jgi:hypothetical protein
LEQELMKMGIGMVLTKEAAVGTRKTNRTQLGFRSKTTRSSIISKNNNQTQTISHISTG